MNVSDTVATDIVHADIEEVGAVSDLALSNLDTVVNATLEHRIPERPRAISVSALTDGEIAVVLAEAHVLIQARNTVIRLGFSDTGTLARQPTNHSTHVFRGCSTAPAHQ